MLNNKQIVKKTASLIFLSGFFSLLAANATASPIPDSIYTPLIVAGAPPDSPGARVDPNVATSAFSGVVSINIVSSKGSFICSGTLVAKRQIVSAGHCIDVDGKGHAVDLSNPANSVTVLFNSSGDYFNPALRPTHVVKAASVTMNPDYQGFGVCPAAVTTPAFCVNDDVAVITLAQDAPSSAKIYRVSAAPLAAGTKITMAGYGTSGDGINGFTVSPSFKVKRSGQNYVDFFDRNDELNFLGNDEVWYADFDGNGQDTHCKLYGICTPILANNLEAGIGGGDSGGPSFIVDQITKEYFLVGNNTFGQTYPGQTPGAFGTAFGGMILSSYIDFLGSSTNYAIGFVPEPGSVAVFLLGLAVLITRRRSITPLIAQSNRHHQ